VTKATPQPKQEDNNYQSFLYMLHSFNVKLPVIANNHLTLNSGSSGLQHKSPESGILKGLFDLMKNANF